MKKCTIISALFLLVVVSSCRSSFNSIIIPRAVNTVNAVRLSELNLTNTDYTILNTITKEATVYVTYSDDEFSLRDLENTFSYTYSKDDDNIKLEEQSGVLRAGYFSNENADLDFLNPESIARRMAVYRLISESQQIGADGLIEPVVSTTFEKIGEGRSEITVAYKTTVSAKPIKLKVTGK